MMKLTKEQQKYIKARIRGYLKHITSKINYSDKQINNLLNCIKHNPFGDIHLANIDHNNLELASVFKGFNKKLILSLFRYIACLKKLYPEAANEISLLVQKSTTDLQHGFRFPGKSDKDYCLSYALFDSGFEIKSEAESFNDLIERAFKNDHKQKFIDELFEILNIPLVRNFLTIPKSSDYCPNIFNLSKEEIIQFCNLVNKDDILLNTNYFNLELFQSLGFEAASRYVEAILSPSVQQSLKNQIKTNQAEIARLLSNPYTQSFFISGKLSLKDIDRDNIPSNDHLIEAAKCASEEPFYTLLENNFIRISDLRQDKKSTREYVLKLARTVEGNQSLFQLIHEKRIRKEDFEGSSLVTLVEVANLITSNPIVNQLLQEKIISVADCRYWRGQILDIIKQIDLLKPFLINEWIDLKQFTRVEDIFQAVEILIRFKEQVDVLMKEQVLQPIDFSHIILRRLDNIGPLIDLIQQHPFRTLVQYNKELLGYLVFEFEKTKKIMFQYEGVSEQVVELIAKNYSFDKLKSIETSELKKWENLSLWPHIRKVMNEGDSNLATWILKNYDKNKENLRLINMALSNKEIVSYIKSLRPYYNLASPFKLRLSTDLIALGQRLSDPTIRQLLKNKLISPSHLVDFCVDSVEKQINAAKAQLLKKLYSEILKNSKYGSHKAPDGIEKLLIVLNHFNLFSLSEEQDKEETQINDAFKKVFDILQEKQLPYHGFGQRSAETASFYKKFYELARSCYPEPKNLTDTAAEVRTASRIISQLQRDTASTLPKLPDEVGIIIAASVANCTQDELKIAERSYGKPNIFNNALKGINTYQTLRRRGCTPLNFFARHFDYARGEIRANIYKNLLESENPFLKLLALMALSSSKNGNTLQATVSLEMGYAIYDKKSQLDMTQSIENLKLNITSQFAKYLETYNAPLADHEKVTANDYQKVIDFISYTADHKSDPKTIMAIIHEKLDNMQQISKPIEQATDMVIS